MKEQPREKLARLGPEGLKNSELLALLLRTGYKGKNVFTLAENLLQKYPKSELFEMPYKNLSKIKGIGKSRAAVIVAGCELSRRLFNKSTHLQIIKPLDVVAQVQEIISRKKEHFVAIYLNARNELLRREFISIGILDASIVHPREVFGPAIEHCAASIILVHNHPSGNTNPSEDDRNLTKKLIDSGEILGIEVLDHIIVSSNDYFSFKDNGIL